MYIFYNFTILLYEIIGFNKQRERERERERERDKIYPKEHFFSLLKGSLNGDLHLYRHVNDHNVMVPFI